MVACFILPFKAG